ncbi:MAG: Fe-S cluster assembly protein SufD [Candidatus Melainabacteria bacterium]|nr:Fe-S cluster assembly protein SufD [Candidatus Melainabacteria bacterium]
MKTVEKKNEPEWLIKERKYAKNVIIDEPLISKLTLEGRKKDEAVKILIVLEENSSVNLIDEITSNYSDDLQTNIVVEIFLAKGSRLNYLNLQTLDTQTVHHLIQKVQIEEKAEFTNLIVALGSGISRVTHNIDLTGKNSSAITYGIVLGSGLQIFDHHTQINHIAPYTKSHLDFRVALKDKAQSAYTGNLMISKEAIKSDALQENRNLLLSKDAKAESIPELEILTNDVVKCNHGVTIGQVDKEQIYYLMTRGLSEKDAEKIVVEGFLEPTIFKIPCENMREKIIEKIQNKLEVI